jgi:drug/metabolite transporter (DMT)-like permease
MVHAFYLRWLAGVMWGIHQGRVASCGPYEVNYRTIMKAPTSNTLLRFGFLITTLGGLLFTLDLPLLRLAGAEKWAMVAARGLLLFTSITVSWLIVRMVRGGNGPFIAGRAGIAVIATNTVANIAFIGASVETDIANVVFILALVPILTAIFARLFLGEPVHPFTWLASVLAFVGVFIIIRDGLQSSKIIGDIMALVCACCTAAAFTIIRASGKNVATSLGLGSLASAVVALLFFNAQLDTLFQPAGFGVPAWAWLALNGLLVIPLSSTLIANGPRYLPSVDVSMFFLLETVLTPIWMWMLFGEIPSRAVLWGGMLIVTTLLAHSVWRLRVGMASAPLEKAYAREP